MHAGVISSVAALCSTITLKLTGVLAICALPESAYWLRIPEKMFW